MTGSQALEAVIDTVAEFLHVRIGLRPDTTLRGRLRRAIRDEASRHGQDPASYLTSLMADGSVLQGLMNAVTVQETGFFRHPEQFDALVDEVLPGLPRPVRIWSAGCAHGQEAYSLAMLLEERGVDGTVTATDLSTAALHRTATARYGGRELAGLSPARLAHHFTRVEDAWEVDAAVRGRVRILHHNLLDPIPREVKDCQVVFCRNVLIYLSPHQVRRFLDRVADELAPTTTLFVGAAETIWQVSDRFQAVHGTGAFIYRQRPEGARRTTSAGTGRSPEPGRRRPPEAVRVPAPRRHRRRPEAQAASATDTPSTPKAAAPEVAVLEKAAQDAVASGDYQTAVVAFRKCAYLQPHDPLAQLHLGLALEASGDAGSAGRAFAAARRALAEAGPELVAEGFEGYSVAELRRLLDSKR